MDGFVPLTLGRRRRLASSIGCKGVGLHTGQMISLTMHPAESGSGIVFHRTDLGISIPARFDNVFETRLCTGLSLPEDRSVRVGTIEHLMAALAATGIDDAFIELDGPEVPILDGSADPFLFLIDCAGISENIGSRRTIEVLKTVRAEDGHGGWVELSPSDDMAFEAELTIDFADTAIGEQSLSLRVTSDSFRTELANARTFTLAEEISRLRAAGLARGGSLSNAIVVDGMMIVNPGGLRRPDEFVRHKMLDVVGDLALAGSPIAGQFRGYRSGHALNNALLRQLFADRSAWRFAGGHALVDAGPVRQAVAA